MLLFGATLMLAASPFIPTVRRRLGFGDVSCQVIRLPVRASSIVFSYYIHGVHLEPVSFLRSVLSIACVIFVFVKAERERAHELYGPV